MTFLVQGHFRQGSAYAGMKKHKEALAAFCKSFTWTKHDSEREGVAREIISNAMQVPGTAYFPSIRISFQHN